MFCDSAVSARRLQCLIDVRQGKQYHNKLEVLEEDEAVVRPRLNRSSTYTPCGLLFRKIESVRTMGLYQPLW